MKVIVMMQSRRKTNPEYAAKWAIAVALLSGFLPAVAQDAAETASAPAGTLGPRYVDGSFGFAVAPPADCETLREKRFMETGEEVEVVRFVNVNALWSLGVRQSKLERAVDPESVGEMIVGEMQETCRDISIVKTERSTAGSREVLRCTATMTSRGVPMIRQQAMIRVKPSEYFTLVFATPQSDEKVATALFEKIVAGFEVLRSEAQEKQIRDALRRGSALLELVRSGSLDVVCREPREVFLRCLEGGIETGFMQIRMEPRTVEHRTGMTIAKYAWFFRPDDSVSLMRQEMFVTSNLSFERWESRLIVVAPLPKGGGRREISQDIESGIRQDNKLLVGYMGKSIGPQITQKELDVDRTYASAPWDVILPSIVDLKKSDLYAFSWYDSSRRGLSLQTFRLAGRKSMPSGKEATLIEQSEGLVPPVHEVYVDDTGQIVRVLMKGADKPMEMHATTRRDIERRYGDRVKEIERLMPAPRPRETAPAPGNRPATPNRAAAPKAGGANR